MPVMVDGIDLDERVGFKDRDEGWRCDHGRRIRSLQWALNVIRAITRGFGPLGGATLTAWR